MEIITNAKWPDFFSWIGKASCRFAGPSIPHLECHPGTCLENNNRGEAPLIRRHQTLIRATKAQLDSKGGRDQNVYFPRLNFLQIARSDFGAFGEFVLRQFLAHTLAAHISTEDLDSLPFFLGNGHDILHRFLMIKMNDTYIVKMIRIFLASTGKEACNQRVSRQMQKQFQRA
jgi:hypothetical protein